jgi:TolA-binding protein
MFDTLEDGNMRNRASCLAIAFPVWAAALTAAPTYEEAMDLYGKKQYAEARQAFQE